MAIIKQQGFLTSDEAFKLYTPVVTEIFDEWKLDSIWIEDVTGKLAFTDEMVNTYHGQIQTKLWVMGSGFVWELDTFKINSKNYWPKMSFEVERAFVGSGMSSKAAKYLETVNGSSEIPSDILAEIKSSLNGLADLSMSIKLTENEYTTKLFTEWFKTVTASFWPWAAVIDGKALFATNHVIAATGATYSNIQEDATTATNYAALSFTALKAAVNKLRGMKDGLGRRLPLASSYRLVVSPELEQTALEILVPENEFTPFTFTGTAAGNNNYTNVFMGHWFKVELEVLNTLNQPSVEDGVDDTIGSNTMWFLINVEAAKMRKAFRKLKFWDLTIDNYYDDANKAHFVTAEKFYGVMAIYPEVIIGSKWAGAI